MVKILIQLLAFVLIAYTALCVVLYFYQEKIIFYPEKLDRNYRYNFAGDFEEVDIKTEDGTRLNALLFKAENSEGLIFYLHGNAGNLSSWGWAADVYTRLNYDVFIIDYRGYGKSGGKITSQKQLFGDIQTAYNEMKKRYNEDEITVLGYSIGGGPASKIAADNNPVRLILQAPFYSMTDLMRKHYPLAPAFLLKYTFPVHEFLKNYPNRVIVFHGSEDEIVPFRSSLKLKKEFGEQLHLITLEGQGHNGMTDNREYRRALSGILGG